MCIAVWTSRPATLTAGATVAPGPPGALTYGHMPSDACGPPSHPVGCRPVAVRRCRTHADPRHLKEGGRRRFRIRYRCGAQSEARSRRRRRVSRETVCRWTVSFGLCRWVCRSDCVVGMCRSDCVAGDGKLDDDGPRRASFVFAADDEDTLSATDGVSASRCC